MHVSKCVSDCMLLKLVAYLFPLCGKKRKKNRKLKKLQKINKEN